MECRHLRELYWAVPAINMRFYKIIIIIIVINHHYHLRHNLDGHHRLNYHHHLQSVHGPRNSGGLLHIWTILYSSLWMGEH